MALKRISLSAKMMQKNSEKSLPSISLFSFNISFKILYLSDIGRDTLRTFSKVLFKNEGAYL